MDEPFPGMPAPPPRASRDPKAGIRANRVRSTNLCEECCLLIHIMGVAVAPYPRMARWRVVDGEKVYRLCEVHKEEKVT